MSQTRAALINAATLAFEQAGVDDPAREARLLMRWACDLDGAALAARMNEPCTPEQEIRFAIGMSRRATREPLSHITGKREFWGRSFRVTRDVLDPRPETEILVAEALNRGPFGTVLDLGIGSGCILVSLLAEWPEARGTGTDTSQAALAIAARNAEAHGVFDRLTLTKTDWTDGLMGAFDLVVSNPPYLAAEELADLSPEVGFEPAHALSPGGDGLDAYRAIARGAPRLMAPDALLMLEIGPTQSHEVSAILASAGFNVVAILPDLDQRPRAVLARI